MHTSRSASRVRRAEKVVKIRSDASGAELGSEVWYRAYRPGRLRVWRLVMSGVGSYADRWLSTSRERLVYRNEKRRADRATNEAFAHSRRWLLGRWRLLLILAVAHGNASGMTPSLPLFGRRSAKGGKCGRLSYLIDCRGRCIYFHLSRSFPKPACWATRMKASLPSETNARLAH
jgi:hypothetical protein